MSQNDDGHDDDYDNNIIQHDIGLNTLPNQAESDDIGE